MYTYNKHLSLIIFIIMFILAIIYLILIVTEHAKYPIQNTDNSNKEVYSGNNLTYSFYNHTTGKVIILDSNIPIYNNIG